MTAKVRRTCKCGQLEELHDRNGWCEQSSCQCFKVAYEQYIDEDGQVIPQAGPDQFTEAFTE